MARYKVWVEIEEITEEGEATGNETGVLPDSLGVFETLDQAKARQWEVVLALGIKPELSDARSGPDAR